jgi:hypothetical protein
MVVCVLPGATQHLLCATEEQATSSFAIRCRLEHVITRETQTSGARLSRLPLSPRLCPDFSPMTMPKPITSGTMSLHNTT